MNVRKVLSKQKLASLPLILLASAGGMAQEQNAPGPVEQLLVTGQSETGLSGTGSADDMLSREGVNFSSAGGISALPVLRGLNDDRIKVSIDGAEVTSSCANHMNPPLSYIDASRIESVEVIAGLTPVSAGGDSIAGTIAVLSQQPRYAEAAGELLLEGSAGYFYQSNANQQGVALNAGVANHFASLGYSGSYDEADSYEDGNGDKVLDTLYRSQSHNLTLGLRGEQQSATLKLNYQKVPYQGFPNQYMDMVDNTSFGLNLNYLREFAWGQLDTRLTWQDVEHEMGFFSDEKPGTMPMNTEGQDIGYKIAAIIPLRDGDILRLGNEYHRFTLDDWWPAVPGSMMMGPDNYSNINDGERTRYAVYAEVENAWSPRWSSQAGVRYERVVSDTGDVQPYNSMTLGGGMTMGMAMPMANPDAAAASAFNARDHRREDDNIDLTLVGRYALTGSQTLDFGYARKTRSPNLYERYSWGRGTMAMTMIGWYGDGNGYVGDIDLDPEIAHTLSATWQWAEDDNNLLSLTPYYTYVDDFIDARQVGSFNPRNAMQVTRPLLQFTNLDAELYGAELHGRRQLWSDERQGLQLDARLAYTRGERSDDGGNLYHIMPLNAVLALEHQASGWRNRVEYEWVDRKDRVDELRLENATGGYGLVNASTEYRWRDVTVSAAIDNLLDEEYELPLGGVYLSGWLAGERNDQFAALPGEGRTFKLGLQYSF
ncbi:TonB-dependent receptor [Haliea sp. E17]|uniref:TonB-dependent receptor n=1 Tax=Haliea sp. E17 TaxID=3401576 RepID=UPI003AAD55B9